MSRKGITWIAFDDLNDAYRLWFYCLFFTDMVSVRSACARAIAMSRMGDDGQNPNHNYQAFNDAAVVRYARCFMGCRLPDGKGKTRLPDRYVFDGPLGDIHAKAMAIRHGIVAHTDLRERRVTLSKGHEGVDSPDRWQIKTSGGAMTPSAITVFSALCEQLRKLVVREALPLIEKQVETMKFGEELDLRTLVEDAQPGGVTWVD